MDARDIILEPLITEKSMNLVESQNKFTFKVARSANKIQIKQAIEEIFAVSVLSVNTINVPKKKVRRGKYEGFKKAYKKAIVELPAGSTIKGFEV